MVEETIGNSLINSLDSYIFNNVIVLIFVGILWILSLILVILGHRTTKEISNNIKSLEDILNRTVREIDADDDFDAPSINEIKSINLIHLQGDKEAYKFLEAI